MENLVKLLDEMRATLEIQKANEHSFRSVPLDKITDVHRGQIKKWMEAVKALPNARQRLFLEAVERAGAGESARVSHRATYERQLRAIQAVIEESTIRNRFTVITKEVSFDPRIMLEITKLGHTFGRGHSFIVHLLALYGLRAIADGLKSEGISPPASIARLPTPKAIMAADDERRAIIKRYVFGQNGEIDPVSSLDELVFNESTFYDEDLGEDDNDLDTRSELGEL